MRRWGAVGVVVLLSACQSPLEMGLNGAGLLSFMQTGKGLSDHVLSWVLSGDCAFTDVLTDGRLCRKSAVVAPVPPDPPVYCYRTLGAVNCYRDPDPDAPPSRSLN